MLECAFCFIVEQASGAGPESGSFFSQVETPRYTFVSLKRFNVLHLAEFHRDLSGRRRLKRVSLARNQTQKQ
jgi:hypothetical protein